jgi:sugar phosphate isomerase/epimerase
MVSLAAFPKCWLDEISAGKMDLDEWIDLSVQLEADGLELYSLFLKSHESGYLAYLRRKVEGLGMTIPMMCYSPDFTHPDKDFRAKEVEKQKEMIRVTAELGGRFCRTLSGQKRPEVGIKEGSDYVAECIEACLRDAEKNNVILVIENHYKDGFWQYIEFAQKQEVFLPLVERIQSPWFGIQFDPSNALVAGEDPVEFLKKTVGRVRTMHASDRYLVPGSRLKDVIKNDGSIGYPDKLVHGVTGEGSNDFGAIFSILRDNGFAGWISIEDGMNGMDEMKRSIRFLKEMRKKYFKTQS